MSDYRAQSCTIKSPEEIKQAWNDLQQRAECSYFQSWGWVGTWLEHLASDLDPVIVRVWFGDMLVGLGLFVSKQVVRRSIVHSNAMFLNECPFSGRNMIIEYNGLLVDRNHRQAVYREAIKHLHETYKNCDEFFFGGLSESEDVKLLQENNNNSETSLQVLEESLAWRVDLNAFDRDANAFLGTLSKNRRAQIRRSIKAYEEQAPLKLEQASDTEAALQFFDGLKELHTSRWQSKGGQGCFANPLWENFHRSLIRSRFAKGEVQLLRVSVSGEAIGYLYNFIWRKHIYVLQTGFRLERDKQLMPGYVVHVLAIAHNKEKGMEVYDLMHGDSLYKKILCNQTQKLCWTVLQRPRIKFVLENMAVKVVRSFRGIMHRGA